MIGRTKKVVVEGHVDGREGSHLRGWAWRPDAPERAVRVEVWRGGTLLARGTADELRADLEAAGKRGGACAFSIHLDADISGEITVRTAGEDGGVELRGSPLTLTRQPRSGVVRAPVTLPGWMGGLDHLGPARVSGWLRAETHASAKPVLELWADGAPVHRFTADGWRLDLEELCQGDGRWAFDTPLPPAVRDGAAHSFDLRLADGGPSVIGHDILVFVPVADVAGAPAAPAHAPEPEPAPAPHPASAEPELSIVVNFYNMRREAERTLTSLTRAYQRGSEDLAYEVICVDNGSNPPLDAGWVESFGPEFRLLRPEQPLASPCAALNAAAREARGRHVAVMIDGAHVLTPGVFAEALPHLRAARPAVVALRHWFVGGDQRWLSVIGYTREQEDVLFDRIGWPGDGYKLFRIGSPIGESQNAWFDGLSESNCLFVPAAVWRAIGGFDEAFVQPGGGLANLDLLKRAAAAAEAGVVCLVGEATFHQYHGGTTTNVDDAEKDVRVDAYEREYVQLRGERFASLKAHELRLAGRMRQQFAYNIGQRPMYPAPLGVTDRVRQASAQHRRDVVYDKFLPGLYAELGQPEATCWAGAPVGVGATDLVNIQELIHAHRPTAIVTTSRQPGLLGFLDAICRLEALDGTEVYLPCEQPLEGAPARVQRIDGSPWAKQTLRQVALRVGGAEEVLVLFDGPDKPGVPVDELRAYAGFVSYGSYLVYLNTALGQPFLGYSNRWPTKAIRMLTEGGRYAVDQNLSQTFASTCPNGYVRRVGGLVELADYVADLDDLEHI
jgi:cephalosporin hydroxylase